MTSMWMVQDDDGRYLNWDEGEGRYEFSSFFEGQSFLKARAEDMASALGGHLVELVPAKPKVPVSQEEAELIDDIVNDMDLPSATLIRNYVANNFVDSKRPSEEFRLMEAAIDGYTVVEPTKYNVKVPHTTDGYYSKRSDTDGLATWNKADSELLTRGFTRFTMAEIKHYGLEDCERVEINREDSDD